MKKFFTCYNNSVVAIVDEATFASIQKHHDIQQTFTKQEEGMKYEDRWRADAASRATKYLTVPVFTFVRQERFKESPWFTGDKQLMDALAEHLKERGDLFERAGFYVPFSNGCEVGMHGKEAMASELAYVTTEKQFEEVFGVSINFLVTKYGAQTAV